MKLTIEAYSLICEILENEANNKEGEEQKAIKEALAEVDAIGTY